MPQLGALIEHLASAANFSDVELGKTPISERRQIIMRLIYVVFVQCASHSWQRKSAKKASETKADTVLQEKRSSCGAAVAKTNADDAPPSSSGGDGANLEAHELEANEGDNGADEGVAEGGDPEIADADEGDAEPDEESDLEQAEVAESGTGEEASSSRDATPQQGLASRQGDTGTSTASPSNLKSEEHDATAPLTYLPQIVLALKTADILVSAGAVEWCYSVLESLKKEWATETISSRQYVQQLSAAPPELQPNLAPLFNAQAVN
ncbi:unnamed protein product, partial [Gongylonema pulchrum]|uniref:Uncharacterized protein n=1 Tax=Gongylonema pulchrum TaxID=637853 RepID=A0A183EP87_9BILA